MVNKTYVAVVLDKSGSMGCCRDETIKGFNEVVDTIIETSAGENQQVSVSLVTFNNLVSIDFWNKDIDQIAKLKHETYSPGGLTALYDAIGVTLNKLQETAKEDKETDATFLVTIITDGAENNSKEFTRQTIADTIKRLQDTGVWTITYLGANQDLLKVQRDLNIFASNVAVYNSSGEGTDVAFRNLTSATSSYLTGIAKGSTCSASFMGSTGQVEDWTVEKPKADSKTTESNNAI